MIGMGLNPAELIFLTQLRESGGIEMFNDPDGEYFSRGRGYVRAQLTEAGETVVLHLTRSAR